MLHSVAEILIGIAMVAWLVVGTIAQFATDKRLPSLATSRLIPKGNLFSPTPMVDNIYIVVRTRRIGDELSLWEVPPWMQRHRLVEWLWNPQGRIRHSLITCVHHLQKTFNDGPVPIRLSAPYIALLGLAMQHADQHRATEVQFGIVVHRPSSNSTPTLIFLSDLHLIEE